MRTQAAIVLVAVSMVAMSAAFIAEAFKLHSDDIGHLPLHQKALAWGVSKKVDLTEIADNFVPLNG